MAAFGSNLFAFPECLSSNHPSCSTHLVRLPSSPANLCLMKTPLHLHHSGPSSMPL